MNFSGLAAQLATTYSAFGISLVIDAVAIFLMAYVLYFRRHWRADLLLSYITLNVGIFVVMSLLNMVRVDIAVGFGLFAILSIIRLRSSAVTQQEVAYYFVALVMGLVNGLSIADRPLIVALNVLLLLTMGVFDSGRLRNRSRRIEVELKKVYETDEALVADLERQLAGRVMYYEVTTLDLGRHHTTVDVRYRPLPGVAREFDQTGSKQAEGQPAVAVRATDATVTEPAATDATDATAAAPADRTGDLVPVGARDDGRRE